MSASGGWIFSARAGRDFKRLDRPVQRRVVDALDRLTGDPPAGNVVKLANTDEWRHRKVEKFSDDPIARKRSLRAKQALGALANFVEGMSDEDPDLCLHALRRTDARDGGLLVTLDSLTLLSRFGIDRGAWQASRPTESQMRNVLRRIDGIEARERHARKLRAEQGYGDD